MEFNNLLLIVIFVLFVYTLYYTYSNDFGIFLRPILVSYTNDCEKDYNYDFINDSDDDENDVPDTEINPNIFIKMMKDKNTHDINANINDSTSN